MGLPLYGAARTSGHPAYVVIGVVRIATRSHISAQRPTVVSTPVTAEHRGLGSPISISFEPVRVLTSTSSPAWTRPPATGCKLRLDVFGLGV
jgi:hypothetical protein